MMNYRLTIAQKAGFLHALVEGQNTQQAVEGYLEELLPLWMSTLRAT